MIKVLYNKEGQITDLWAINEIPSTPYIEITDEQHKQILKKDCYIVKDGELFNIENEERYILQKAEEEKAKHCALILKKIQDLEKHQARCIREIIISNSQEASLRLKDFEKQIEDLRKQL